MKTIILREKDFEFMKCIGKDSVSLGGIKEKMKRDGWDIQMMFNKLRDLGMVESEKIGRTRFVQLTKNGKYFNEFYRMQKK